MSCVEKDKYINSSDRSWLTLPGNNCLTEKDVLTNSRIRWLEFRMNVPFGSFRTGH